jgi:hypothetical protein
MFTVSNMLEMTRVQQKGVQKEMPGNQALNVNVYHTKCDFVWC